MAFGHLPKRVVVVVVVVVRRCVKFLSIHAIVSWNWEMLIKEFPCCIFLEQRQQRFASRYQESFGHCWPDFLHPCRLKKKKKKTWPAFAISMILTNNGRHFKILSATWSPSLSLSLLSPLVVDENSQSQSRGRCVKRISISTRYLRNSIPFWTKSIRENYRDSMVR